MNNIVFLGSPAVAVPALSEIESLVSLVITQPDRPQGRSGQPQPTPVKAHAESKGIPVIQASTSAEVAEALSSAGHFDAGVVVAFGSLLTPSALASTRRGFLNVHFSLLPRWRGAAPVQSAIAAGDERTGVSLMELDVGLDTGPVVAVRSVSIESAENAGSLTARLGRIGAEMLGSELGAWMEGLRYASRQGEAGATYAPKIGSEHRRLSVDDSAEALVLRIRSLSPSPGAFFETSRGPLKVLNASSRDGSIAPGVLEAEDDLVLLGTGAGVLVLARVQPAGKREMLAGDWLRGNRLPRLE